MTVRRDRLLVLDTATTRAVAAVAEHDGSVLAADAWTAGYRHGEELLPRVEAVLAAARTPRDAIGGIVVGTGPGAFTGLRVGLATAKALAHALDVPLVGVATSEALLAAADDATVLLLPAGPADRVLCRRGEPAQLVVGGHEPELQHGERVVAVDLDGRASEDAVERGNAARASLAAVLARLGAARLAQGPPGPDDLARLVPEYVTLPRGVRAPLPDEAVSVAGGA